MVIVAFALSLTALAVGIAALCFVYPVNRTALHKRVIVNTLTGKGVEGLLYKRSGPLLVLKDATLHEPEQPPVKVDGEVVIESHQVEFVQVL
jgi:hypothetical protein